MINQVPHSFLGVEIPRALRPVMCCARACVLCQLHSGSLAESEKPMCLAPSVTDALLTKSWSIRKIKSYSGDGTVKAYQSTQFCQPADIQCPPLPFVSLPLTKQRQAGSPTCFISCCFGVQLKLHQIVQVFLMFYKVISKRRWDRQGYERNNEIEYRFGSLKEV